MDTTMRQQQRAFHAVAFFGIGILLTLALLPLSERNLLGLCGRAVARVLSAAFGEGAWVFPVFLLDLARAEFLARSQRPRPVVLALTLALVCTALHLAPVHAGGRLGALIGDPLFTLLGVGAYLACAAGVATIVARWAARSPVRAIGVFVWRSRNRVASAWRVASARERSQHARTAAAFSPVSPSLPTPHVRAAEPTLELEPAQPAPTSRRRELVDLEVLESSRVRLAAADANRGDIQKHAIADGAEQEDDGRDCAPYRLPPAALLELPPRVNSRLDPLTLKATALKLAERLAGYGIEGQMDGFTPGPVVTMYEFAPRTGTKLSKITSLDGELSMALEQGVRVLAPLPGTARVGIEVPHPDDAREVVYLRELVDDDRWLSHRAKLPLALGKDPTGKPVFCDLAAAPHLLVAGATGSGKSSGLSTMLTSLVLRRTPDELRFVLIDPKIVELASFAELPHLLAPVVTEMNQAVAALQWAVGEMERRYRLFASVGVRHVDAYNARPDSETLPSIVVVVDEFADLMMAEGKDKRVEPAIARLAQKARASGIHLILATQRPSVDVITGLIKANLPSRIAFRVAQRVDSKVILDRKGAEYLLGRGDMLCSLPGHLDLVRVHGAYVSENDVRTVCDFARAQRAPVYDEAIFADAEQSEDVTDSDESASLYDRVVAYVTAAQACSTSAIQRDFSLGYNRAAKLVERMESEGVVGPAVRAGGKRKVLIEAR